MLIYSVFVIQNAFLTAVAFKTEANLCPCNVQSLLILSPLILDLYVQ